LKIMFHRRIIHNNLLSIAENQIVNLIVLLFR